MDIAEIITSSVALVLMTGAIIGSYSHFIIKDAMRGRDILELQRWQENHDKQTGTLDEKLDEFEELLKDKFHDVELRLDRIERNGKAK